MKSFKKLFSTLVLFLLLLTSNDVFSNSMNTAEFDINKTEFSISEKEFVDFGCRTYTVTINIPLIGSIETDVTLCCRFTGPGTFICDEIPPTYTFNLKKIFDKFDIENVKNVEVLASNVIENNKEKSKIKLGEYTVIDNNTIELEFVDGI